jgi:asparagine synthase (glutamine-hydrolysing)
MQKLIKNDGAGVIMSGAAGDEVLAGYSYEYLTPFLSYLLTSGKLREFYTEIVSNSERSAISSLKDLSVSMFLNSEQRQWLKMHRKGELDLIEKTVSHGVMESARAIERYRCDERFVGRVRDNLTHRLMNYWLRSSAKSVYCIPVELRAPFLDYEVVEFCSHLPPEYLIKKGWHKYLLRRAMVSDLPKEVVWRRNKMGFPFPISEWLVESKTIIGKNICDVDCPFVKSGALMAEYDNLVAVAPLTLWRIVMVALWWRRVVTGQRLSV